MLPMSNLILSHSLLNFTVPTTFFLLGQSAGFARQLHSCFQFAADVVLVTEVSGKALGLSNVCPSTLALWALPAP